MKMCILTYTTYKSCWCKIPILETCAHITSPSQKPEQCSNYKVIHEREKKKWGAGSTCSGWKRCPAYEEWFERYMTMEQRNERQRVYEEGIWIKLYGPERAEEFRKMEEERLRKAAVEKGKMKGVERGEEAVEDTLSEGSEDRSLAATESVLFKRDLVVEEVTTPEKQSRRSVTFNIPDEDPGITSTNARNSYRNRGTFRLGRLKSRLPQRQQEKTPAEAAVLKIAEVATESEDEAEVNILEGGKK